MLVQEYHADDFQPAARGTGAAADETGKDQQDRQERGPVLVGGGGKARRRGDRHGLEDAVADCLQGIIIGLLDTQVDAGDHAQPDQYADERFYLGIPPVSIQAHGTPADEMQGEVDAGNQHEDYGHGVDQTTVEVADALVVGGEAAD